MGKRSPLGRLSLRHGSRGSCTYRYPGKISTQQCPYEGSIDPAAELITVTAASPSHASRARTITCASPTTTSHRGPDPTYPQTAPPSLPAQYGPIPRTRRSVRFCTVFGDRGRVVAAVPPAYLSLYRHRLRKNGMDRWVSRQVNTLHLAKRESAEEQCAHLTRAGYHDALDGLTAALYRSSTQIVAEHTTPLPAHVPLTPSRRLIAPGFRGRQEVR